MYALTRDTSCYLRQRGWITLCMVHPAYQIVPNGFERKFVYEPFISVNLLAFVCDQNLGIFISIQIRNDYRFLFMVSSDLSSVCHFDI